LEAALAEMRQLTASGAGELTCTCIRDCVLHGVPQKRSVPSHTCGTRVVAPRPAASHFDGSIGEQLERHSLELNKLMKRAQSAIMAEAEGEQREPC
jgi:hypothetical protein